MTNVVDFLFNCMFMTDFLICAFFATLHLPKRSLPEGKITGVSGSSRERTQYVSGLGSEYGDRKFRDRGRTGLRSPANAAHRNRNPFLAVLISYPFRAIVCAAAAIMVADFLQRRLNTTPGAPYFLLRSLLLSFSFFLIMMAVVWICVDLKRESLWFVCASIWFVQHGASDIDILLPFDGGKTWQGYIFHNVVVLVVCIAMYLTFFRLLELSTLERMRLSGTIPILIIMVLGCLVINSWAEARGENTLTFRSLDLLCVACGLLYQRSIYMVSGLEKERDNVDRLLEQSRQQYETARRNADRVNIKAHDLKHLIRYYREQGKLDSQVLGEMEKTVSDYDSMVRTGNTALDVILTDRKAACAASGITLTCMAEGAGLSYIEPADLYALFGNALDNAIEAARQLPDPDMKQISLTINRRGSLYSICLQNYTLTPPHIVDGLPQTTKADAQNHGFGMKSMRLLVEKYNGEMDFHTEDDLVVLNMILPARDAAA